MLTLVKSAPENTNPNIDAALRMARIILENNRNNILAREFLIMYNENLMLRSKLITKESK